MTGPARLALGLTLLLTVAACAADEGPSLRPAPACGVDLAPRDQGPRILFIGNSLTYWHDLPALLAWLLTEAQVPYDRIASFTGPDLALQDHWESALVQRALEQPWDIVVLQQGPSAGEGRASLATYASLFAGAVRPHGGVVALFSVWPLRSQPELFPTVTESYALAAAAADGWLLPAGEAWRAAWAERPDFVFYERDGLHPTALGSYLAALVMFEQIAGQPADTLPPGFCARTTGGMPLAEEDARVLQEAATAANAAFARPPAPAPVSPD